jgi:transposase
MKQNLPSKSFSGNIQLTISPQDPVAWKLSMLFEAARAKTDRIVDIAKSYGYSREHFYSIKKAYEQSGATGLMDNSPGPKANYVRTDVVKKQVIRHRFLDPEANSEVITQKMQQSGIRISQRSVERTIKEYGLQKKGYIKQIRKMRG